MDYKTGDLISISVHKKIHKKLTLLALMILRLDLIPQIYFAICMYKVKKE